MANVEGKPTQLLPIVIGIDIGHSIFKIELRDKLPSYISRIENNASDIRLSILMRIIQKGLGGRLNLSLTY